MEPTNLNSSSEDDDLVALFRSHAPAVADNGFSTRVVAALPRSGRSNSMHVGLYVSGAAAGLTVALLNGASWSDLLDAGTRLAQGFAPVVSVTADPGLSLAIVASAISLLVAALLARVQVRRFF